MAVLRNSETTPREGPLNINGGGCQRRWLLVAENPINTNNSPGADTKSSAMRAKRSRSLSDQNLIGSVHAPERSGSALMYAVGSVVATMLARLSRSAKMSSSSTLSVSCVKKVSNKDTETDNDLPPVLRLASIAAWPQLQPCPCN